MRTLVAICLILVSAISITQAQSKYVSRTGHLHVETHSRYLDVIADNYQVYCEINKADGKVRLRGLTKSFEFKMGAIDQAFNSDRVNLGAFTKFDYKGKIANLGSVDFNKPGTYPVTVNGTLHMGSYKRITSARGKIIVKSDGTARAETNFAIRIEEESVNTINRLMKEKLPSVMAIDANKLGISRDIQLSLNTNLKARG